jgi:hypothetical protein
MHIVFLLIVSYLSNGKAQTAVHLAATEQECMLNGQSERTRLGDSFASASCKPVNILGDSFEIDLPSDHEAVRFTRSATFGAKE